MPRLFKVPIITAVFLLSSCVYAASGITYHGRIVKPDNTPLESATTRFRIQIKAPDAGNCVLWEEEQTRNMVSSNGTFAITIGDSTDTTISYTRVDTYGWGMERVFSNRTLFSTLSGCAVGNSYLPNPADGRILEVSFKEAPTDPVWEAFPATKINLIPMSLNSLQLEGYRADEFLKIDPYVNQTPINNAGVNTLLSLIAGTSNLYVKPADPLGGDLTGTIGAGTVVGLRGRALGAAVPAVGQVLKFDGTSWVPSADDTGAAPADASYAAKGIVQFDTSAAVSGVTVTAGVARLADTITAAGPIGSASTVPVITYDAKGRLTTVTTAAVNDATKLPLAGGTMTGPINMGLQNITNATSVAATNFSGRNLLLSDSDTNVATIRAPVNLVADYALTLPTTAPTNGYVLSTDGTGQLSWIAAASGSVTSVTATAPVLSTAGATPVISLDTGLGANKVPQVGGTALGANGVVVANGTATALTSLNCAVNQVIKFDASGFAVCGADDAGAANAFVNGGNAFGAAATLGTNDNFDLSIEANNTTRMTIQAATGNVGIGITNPTSRLEISQTATINAPVTMNKQTLIFTPTTPTSNGNFPQGQLTELQIGGNQDIMGWEANAIKGTMISLMDSGAQSSGGTGVYGQAFQGSDGFTTELVGVAGFGSKVQSGNVSQIVGTKGSAANQSTTGSVTNLIGGGFDASLYAATTATTVRGVSSNINVQAGATASTATGVYTSVTNLGTVTNGYGLYVGNVQATNKWSVYASDATAPSYFAGNVGIGTTSPSTRLDVSGAVRIGNDATACAAGLSGSLRYNGGAVEYCNGTAWQAFGVSGAGLTSLNGQTGNTQTFNVTATGLTPAINSAANVHTLSIPLASGAGVTSGTISKVDYDNFAGKLTSPLTTQGDILVRNATVDTRLPVGTNGQILSANSATATGLEWVAPSTGDITSVVAGAGLTDGGITGDVTLNVAAGNGILVAADSVSVDTGLGINKIPQVGGTALGANGVVVANGTGTALTSLNCLVNQVIKFDASGFAVCGADDSGVSNAFVQNGNSFAADAVLGTNDNNDLIFETNNAPRMAISNSGKISMGTEFPSSVFDLFISGEGTDTSLGLGGGILKLREDATGDTQLIMGAKSGAGAYSWIQASKNDGSAAFPLVLNGSGGNVGIGTTVPESKLDIVGNVSNNVISRIQNTSTSGWSEIAFLTSGGAIGGTIGYGNSAVGAPYTWQRDLFFVGTDFAVPMGLSTNGVERIRITPTGNVGIGTTTPTGTFHVDGGVGAASTSGSNLTLKAQDGGSGNTSGGNLLLLPGALSGTGAPGRVVVGSSTYNVSANSRPQMIIADNTTGQPVLQFEDFGQDNALVGFTNDNYFAMATENSLSGMKFRVNATTNFLNDAGATTAMTILNSGNVGIGTTTPATTLDVAGALSMREMAAPAVSPADQGRIYFDSTSNKFRVSENGGAYVDLVGSGGGSITGLTAGGVTFATSATTIATSSTDYFWDNTNKRLGIGTNSPGSRIHVQDNDNSNGDTVGMLLSNLNAGSAAGTGMTIANNTGNIGFLWTGSSNYALDGGIWQSRMNLSSANGSGGVSVWAEGATSDIRFGTGGTVAANERMRITSSGNVGIGTTTPGLPLVVAGAASAEFLLAENASSTVYAPINAGATDPGSFIEVRNADTTDGNIAAITLNSRNANGNAQRAFVGSVSRSGAGTYTPELVFGQQTGASAYAERMRIAETGYIGIGTTSPTSQLDITGAFTQREMAAPAVSPADQGRIYFDSTSNKFRVSENGGAYVDLVGAGGGATDLDSLTDAIRSGTNLFLGVGVGASASGGSNTGIGNLSMQALTTGNDNVALGSESLQNNTTGFRNVAIGRESMQSNVSGHQNTAVGMYSLPQSTGTNNTAIGNAALGILTANDENTAVGSGALSLLTNALGNTAIGFESGKTAATTSTGNVFLGYKAGPAVNTTIDNSLWINNDSGTPIIFGDFATDRVAINATTATSTLDINGDVSIRGLASAPALSTSDTGKIYYDNTDDKIKVSVNGNAFTNILTDLSGFTPNQAIIANGAGVATSFSCPVGQVLGFDASGFAVCTAVPANGAILLAADGTAGAPGFAFNSAGNNDNGMFLRAANSIAFSTSGTMRVAIGSDGGIDFSGGNPPDTLLTGFKFDRNPFNVTTGNYANITNSALFNGASNTGTTTVILNESFLSNNTSKNNAYAAQNRLGLYEGTLANGVGSQNEVVLDNSATSATLVSGTRSLVTSRAGTTTTANAYHADIEVSTGTVTNARGLYIDALQGTNRWGVYQNGTSDNNYFAGNTGIGSGVTAPSTTLDINGAITQREMAAPAVSPADQGRIYFDSASNKFRVSENGGAYVDLISSGGSGDILNGGNTTGANVSIGTNDNFDLSFETTNVARMTVKATTGYVGIGTASPVGVLDVRGGTSAAATNATDIQLFAQSGSTGTANGGMVRIEAGEPGAGGGNFGSILLGDTDGIISNFISSPGATYIKGKNGAFPSLVVQGSPGNTSGWLMEFENRNAVYVGHMDVNGNLNMDGFIGAGTPSALSPIHANARSTVSNTVIDGLKISREDTDSAGANGIGVSLDFQLETTTNNVFREVASINAVLTDAVDTSKDADLIFSTVGPDVSGATAPTEKMRIKSSGNIGIGTANPGAPLDIAHNNAAGLNLTHNGTSFSSFLQDASGGTILMRNSAGMPTVILSSSTNSFMTGGNVGIGTNAPSTILDVAGALTVREMAAPAVSPADQGRIYFDSTSNKFRVSENGGAYVDLVGGGGGGGGLPAAAGSETAPSIAFTADPDTGFYNGVAGGIYMTNNGVDSAHFDTNFIEFYRDVGFTNGSAANPALFQNLDFTTGIFFPAASNIAISTSGTERLRVDASGNIGIGRAPSSTAKLAVTGAAVSTTNIVATGATVNLALSNMHMLKSPGTDAITLQNPTDGGTYTIFITDTTSRTYTFAGCTNSYFSPANDATTFRSSYTIAVIVDGANTECFITWTTGFN